MPQQRGAHPDAVKLGRDGSIPADPRNWTLEQLRAVQAIKQGDEPSPPARPPEGGVYAEILAVLKDILAWLEKIWEYITGKEPPPPTASPASAPAERDDEGVGEPPPNP